MAEMGCNVNTKDEGGGEVFEDPTVAYLRTANVGLSSKRRNF